MYPSVAQKPLVPYNHVMLDVALTQKQSQKQVQRLSQQQVISLRLLQLSSPDLLREIDEEAAKNPALKVIHAPPFRERIGDAGAAGERAAESFQAALEATVDECQTLQGHLLSQLHMMRLGEEESLLCQKLIYNLDDHGFHVLSPASLLDKRDKRQTLGFLQKCIQIVQTMDPAGVCVANVQESLLTQAQLHPDAPPLAFFILDGHMDFLDPPKPESIAHKVRTWRAEREKLFALPQGETLPPPKTTAAQAEEALSFIRTLDPYPARGFGHTPTHYVSPDVYVGQLDGETQVPPNATVVTAGGTSWAVRLSHEVLPAVTLDPAFLVAARQEGGAARQQLAQAKGFLAALEFRANTVLRVCCQIVRVQSEFFLHGEGHLSPLTQRQVADLIGVHSTTVSRTASSKYLQCKQGLFALSYFFTGAVSTTNPQVSRDAVLHEMKALLSAASGKAMSDSQIACELEKRGMKIARRTVAKYRDLLGVPSSHKR